MATVTSGSSCICKAQLNHRPESSLLLLPRHSSSSSSSSSVVCIPRNNNGFMRLKTSGKKAMNVSRSPTSSVVSVVASSEFALQEASKFREDLFNELGKYETLLDTRGRIADTCAKVLQEYASTYSGVFTPPQPVDGMKKALEEQGLPTEKPLCCAIWWVRAHFNRDWERFNALKP